MRQTQITFNIGLDEENVPFSIDWDATDSGTERKPAKAIMLSMWDPEEKGALRIDLWTKEMSVGEMNHFFYQTLMTFADTYERATNNKEISVAMKEFAIGMGRKTEVIK
ncbi:MAG: gliding motility protein GldC [Bacteroidetes bacterium]|nr:gliding motility protein GldC [Bacteroidota bacterium]